MTRTPLKSHNEKGFTLIELMIVIMIIAILSAAAMFSFVLAKDRAKVASCIESMDSMRKGLANYQSEIGTFPSGVSSIDDLRTAIAPYMTIGNQDMICTFVSYTSNGYDYVYISKVSMTGGHFFKVTATEGGVEKEPW
jgi:type IV pilus assembly protein PilA